MANYTARHRDRLNLPDTSLSLSTGSSTASGEQNITPAQSNAITSSNNRAIHHHLPLNSPNIGHRVLNSRSETSSASASGASQPAAPRWKPTAAQLAILEEEYNGGMPSPTEEQIHQLTARLRCHGDIQGKNVFYWFQNRKGSERLKTRRRRVESALMSTQRTPAKGPISTTLAASNVAWSGRGIISRIAANSRIIAASLNDPMRNPSWEEDQSAAASPILKKLVVSADQEGCKWLTMCSRKDDDLQARSGVKKSLKRNRSAGWAVPKIKSSLELSLWPNDQHSNSTDYTSAEADLNAPDYLLDSAPAAAATRNESLRTLQLFPVYSQALQMK